MESSFNDRIKSGAITNLTITKFMKDAQILFQSQMKNVLKKGEALKVYTILSVEYAIIKADVEIVEIKYFNTKAEPILRTTNLKQWFTENVQQRIEKDMEEFQEKDSGWTL